MWKDTETYEDLLGYKVHARMLKNIILDDPMLPISIGIFGNWGSGKSSLMLLLENELKEYQNIQDEKKKSAKGRILQIRFNSWQFENYENTKYALVDTILHTIIKDVNANRKKSDKLTRLIKRVKWVSVLSLAFTKAKDSIPLPQYVPSLEELKGLIKDEEYQEVLDDCKTNRAGNLVSSFRSNFQKLILEAEYKAVVVYIDDLDRCAPERVIECLEAVKLFLNVDHTAFIIGADIRIIEYAITHHYPIENKQEDKYSPFSDYLEKLIQIPYKIPKLSKKEQETYILLLLAQQFLSELYPNIICDYRASRESDRHARYGYVEMSKNCKVDDPKFPLLVEIIPLMLEFLNGNPRQLKRFLNTLDVRLRLAEAAELDVRPDILAKLMTLEYNPKSRNQFEDLYKKQLQSGYIENIEEIQKDAIEGKIEKPDWKIWDSPSHVKWLASEPSLDNVNLRDYFWISRDSLNELTPIESFISSRIKNIFERLLSIPTISVIKNEIPKECSSITIEEREQLIALINQALRKNAINELCWNILNNDEHNLIIPPDVESVKSLFIGIKINQLTPMCKKFFKRMSQNKEIQEFVDTMNLDKRLQNAITAG